MSGNLSFADAVALLGGRGRIAVAIDRVTGGVLLAAAAAGAPFVLNLFDPRNEIVSLGGELVKGAVARLRGLSRFDRSERLAAAHAVIVVTSFVDALAQTPLPFSIRDAGLSKADWLTLATAQTGSTAASNAERSKRRLAVVADGLLQAGIPMPTAARPWEQNLAELDQFYRHLAADLQQFLSGLAVWDELDDTRRSASTQLLTDDLSQRAMKRYEEEFRRLALEVPEVAYWANALDHQGTRAAIGDLAVGLARLETLVQEMSSGREPDRRRQALAQSYRMALTRPILSAGDVPAGIRIPVLQDAYVIPDFRVGEVDSVRDIVSEQWWDERPVRDDLEDFLVGYLAGVPATRGPLLVLGQPGSGKSVLTRILAARLPAQEYLVIRVVLREVPAEVDLQSQMEYAIRAVTGESLSWAELAGSSGDALPVVLLDGFDELLQATGTNQTDYLERVAEFQRREAGLGRPVAVFVTSRTAVADRARCTPGTVALRIEPFRPEHVERWLGCWNRANAGTLADRGLRELPAEVVLANPELATQPLLLLMLALYDADGNALQRLEKQLSHAELYERLLTRFAEREVLKDGANLPPESLAREVESELTRLSIIAFAMFNRGRQWITEAELNLDLPVLLGVPKVPHGSGADLRAKLTPGELAVGRFFFVHQASAMRDGVALRTFEFLHATFGEYLLARLVAHELSDLAQSTTMQRGRVRQVDTDDAFLHALLSFAPLTMRASAVGFLRELLQSWPDERKAVLREPVLELFRRSQFVGPTDRYAQYQPVELPVPARHALYACNLLMLVLVLKDGVSASELFQRQGPVVHKWRNMMLLWRSQLPNEGWGGLMDSLEIERIWTDRNTVDMHIELASDSRCLSTVLDPRWIYHDDLFSPETSQEPYWSEPFGWRVHNAEAVQEHAYVMADRRFDVLAHVVEPLAKQFPEFVVTFLNTPEGAQSAANLLVELWLASSTDSEPEELRRLYEQCLTMADSGFPVTERFPRQEYVSLILHQLVQDAARLPREWRHDFVNRVRGLIRQRRITSYVGDLAVIEEPPSTI